MRKMSKNDVIDKIVQDFLLKIDNTTRDILLNAQPNEFGDYASQFHFTLGIQIRNKYNLWDYGNADDLSSIIINKTIKILKEK